ncbi:uncharacterized protein LOC117169901 [Belonocnema kinseyi]|uniref:uncharacterized protein LOC117169901 n=1 Tax=Belonocnema kinseyi TaxID=2817044 RepID=UPI00143D79A1|nr:uncharacterized protein LOC117169901 [Belonocnema kinseyi]
MFANKLGQVDLWTKSSTGCECSFNSSSKDCACCVPSGGCSCGAASPNRCAQCGLEQHCANMCNITLDSRQLFSKSDRGFGQIKSPSLQGPTRCTYKFIPDTGQRVELQIYRIISIGKHNGTACEGGWLQLQGGARVCGRNERFDPPIVLFSDKSVAILHMQINENTSRSQFLAYFSFASNASTSVGYPVRGGTPVNNTECDWVYEDMDCPRDCVLASPGYPGVYAPNTRCRYLITSSRQVSIAINFTAVLMPHNHCTNDYIAVYSGSTTTSPLLKMLCGNDKAYVVHTGQNLLVEFRSGFEVPPYNYNGFAATLSFLELTTEAPTTVTMESTNRTLEMIRSPSSSNNHDMRYTNRDLQGHRKDEESSMSCEMEVSGDKIRAGHHDTRGKLKSTTCRLILRGRVYDTVHVSLIGYNLSAPSCKSSVEVIDGSQEGSVPGSIKSLKRICSPAQNPPPPLFIGQQSYVEAERYSSTGREMTVILKRAADSPNDEEYMDVSFYFHDEREGGTRQPESVCDVEYYGLTSPAQGSVVHPEPHRLFVKDGPVKCRQLFIPAANQSVIITVESSEKEIRDHPCSTECGDSGCRCTIKANRNKTMDEIDHLLLVSDTGHVVHCLCGDYQGWLPVGIRSSTPVYIEWSRFSTTGLTFKAGYKFAEDVFCKDHETAKPEGEVHVGDAINVGFKLNQYYQQRCTWILVSPTNRLLTIEIESTQSRPCTAWNLTIHEYKKKGNPEGPRLYTFCSRDGHRSFTLPDDVNNAIVKLQALGRTAPQYTMKWRSETNSTLNRKNGLSPVTNQLPGSSNGIRPSAKNLVTFLTIVFGSITCFNYRSV